MASKMITVFTAAAIAVSITSVASVSVVPEAQAFGLKSIEKGLKSVKKGAQKTVKKTWKGAKFGAKVMKGGSVALGKAIPYFGKAYVDISMDVTGKVIGKGIGAAKNIKKSTKGAGLLALGTVKSAGRTIDRRLSKGCRALGSCRGTITHGVARRSPMAARRTRGVALRSHGAARKSHGTAHRFQGAGRTSHNLTHRSRSVARR